MKLTVDKHVVLDNASFVLVDVFDLLYQCPIQLGRRVVMVRTTHNACSIGIYAPKQCGIIYSGSPSETFMSYGYDVG